jgi:hypothetical protein
VCGYGDAATEFELRLFRLTERSKLLVNFLSPPLHHEVPGEHAPKISSLKVSICYWSGNLVTYGRLFQLSVRIAVWTIHADFTVQALNKILSTGLKVSLPHA